jgi:hypothetical protein
MIYLYNRFFCVLSIFFAEYIDHLCKFTDLYFSSWFEGLVFLRKNSDENALLPITKYIPNNLFREKRRKGSDK